jgi:hypothetical protein
MEPGEGAGLSMEKRPLTRRRTSFGATLSHKGRGEESGAMLSPHPLGGLSGCTISTNGGSASQRAAWASNAG